MLHFADGLFEDLQSYLGKACLLLDQIDFAEIALSIHEILYVFDEIKMRKFPSKLFDIGAETKAYDCGCFIAEDLGQHVIEDLALLQRNKVNEERVLCSTDLEETGLGLVKLSELWSPFRVNADELVVKKDR